LRRRCRTQPSRRPPGSIQRGKPQQGRALYGRNCASCHGASLQSGAGPALIGSNFSATWGTRTVGNLVDFAHSQMPPGKPGSVTVQDDLAIIAFILQMNHASAGTTALAQGSPLLGRTVADALRAPGSVPPGPSTAAAPQAAAVLTASSALPAQSELDRADEDPRNWLMYNKGYRGERYSRLKQITAANASRLSPVCAYQLGAVGPFQAGRSTGWRALRGAITCATTCYSRPTTRSWCGLARGNLRHDAENPLRARPMDELRAGATRNVGPGRGGRCASG
jgi:hypothetical protein